VLIIDCSPPPQPGTYLLWFDVTDTVRFPDLRFRLATLPPGTYVYIGSALGPGGLQARLRRHTGLGAGRQPQRRHWHVDHLTAQVRPAHVGFVASPDRLECAWIAALHAAGALWAIDGFGSSDCRQGCRTHLLAIPPGWTLETVKDLVA
jgi:Uri superfamily endonuclease